MGSNDRMRGVLAIFRAMAAHMVGLEQNSEFAWRSRVSFFNPDYLHLDYSREKPRDIEREGR